MKKRIAALAYGSLLSVCAYPAYATNLMQIYQQALQNDPTFKAAAANWQAQAENLPIARSYVLPNVSANGSWTRNKIVTETPGTPDITYYDNSKKYGLSLTQPIFNFASWAGIRGAHATVKQAEANYNAAAQDLMIRVATAYFNVLLAYDNLQTTQAEERSLARQLQQTEERYRVGLIAITGVNQIRASYDATVAQEIAAKNNLSDSLEELHAITGGYYPELAGLTSKLPLVTPQPANIDQWVNTAIRQNYSLQAANFGAQVAKANVSVQAAGHLPTVAAVGGYTYDNESNTGPGGFLPNTKTVASAGISVNLPVFAGGLVTAQTRQAGYEYAEASAQSELSYRNTVTQTREAYLGVISDISKLKADKQAIVSSESALKATEAAYLVGTNTIVDVLQQQSTLYNAQRDYSADQYNYLLNTLTLKEAAGTLNPQDLATINSWLGKQIVFKESDTDSSHYTAEKVDLAPVDTQPTSTVIKKPALKTTGMHGDVKKAN